MKWLQEYPPAPALPMTLSHVRDIEFFEGPLLSLFYNEDNEPYVYHWCDSDEKLNRWLVFRTTRHQLVQYEVRRITLKRLIASCRDRFVYACDLDDDGEVREVRSVPVAQIPTEYLPKGETYFAGELVQPEGAQDVLVAGTDWGYERIAEFPRKYLQAYAFTRLFGRRGDPKAFTTSLDLTSGWVFHTLYEAMRRIGGSVRADLAEVSIASPGYMRLSVESDTAADLREVVSRYMRSATVVNAAARTLRDWSNEHEKLSDDGVKNLLASIEKTLGIRSGLLAKRTNTLKDAAKVMTSFVRRVEVLAKYHLYELASIVGVDVPREEVDKSLLNLTKRHLASLDVDDAA